MIYVHLESFGDLPLLIVMFLASITPHVVVAMILHYWLTLAVSDNPVSKYIHHRLTMYSVAIVFALTYSLTLTWKFICTIESSDSQIQFVGLLYEMLRS